MRSEDRCQRTDVRGQRPEERCQRTDVRGQRSDDRGQKLEGHEGGSGNAEFGIERIEQKTEVSVQITAIKWQRTDDE